MAVNVFHQQACLMSGDWLQDPVLMEAWREDGKNGIPHMSQQLQADRMSVERQTL